MLLGPKGPKAIKILYFLARRAKSIKWPIHAHIVDFRKFGGLCVHHTLPLAPIGCLLRSSRGTSNTFWIVAPRSRTAMRKSKFWSKIFKSCTPTLDFGPKNRFFALKIFLSQNQTFSLSKIDVTFNFTFFKKKIVQK